MLNVQSLIETKEIESQKKDIDIIFDDENLFHLAFELPSAIELKANHCKPIPKVSVIEISAQDPFNFKDLFKREFANLSRKHERFKESTSFILKLTGAATLSGELDKAENILSKTIDKKPESKLHHKLGDILILKGRDDKAIKSFEKTNLDEDIYSNLRIAYIYTKQNDLNSAVKYLENAQRIDPCDFRAQMFMGAIQLNQGQCERAIRSFRIAATGKKDSSALHVNLAASHWALGHSEKAIKELKKAITINPMSENALIFYSDIMFQLKRNEKVILPLEFHVKLNEKSNLVWERLARAYYLTDNFSKAKYALENQLSLIDEPYIYNNLGVVYWQLRERKTALKYLYESIQKTQFDDKKVSIPLLNMATALNESCKYKECYNLLKHYIKQDNLNINERILARLVIQYIVSLEGIDDIDTAAKELNEFFSKPISDVEGRILLLSIKIYYDAVITKNYDVCKKDTEILVPLLRDHGKSVLEDIIRVAYNNIAFNYLLYNSVNDAQYYINKIAKYVNVDPYCTATYGLYYLKNRNIDKAIKLYETAISLASNRVYKDRIRQRMNLELGKYSLEIGNNKVSMKYLNKSIKENNGFKYVRNEAINLMKSLQ